MERSPVVPGSPYFMMTYDMAKNLTGITEQTGILAITVTPNHFDEVLSAVQEIAEQNGKISVNTIEQTIKNIEYRYSSSIKALYMAAAILFTFGGISLMNMLMVDFQNRKREFGLLEAVGATQKQLKAMLSREIGIYLGGSLTVSLVLGSDYQYHSLPAFGGSKSLYHIESALAVPHSTYCCNGSYLYDFHGIRKS